VKCNSTQDTRRMISASLCSALRWASLHRRWKGSLSRRNFDFVVPHGGNFRSISIMEHNVTWGRGRAQFGRVSLGNDKLETSRESKKRSKIMKTAGLPSIGLDAKERSLLASSCV